MSSTSRLAAHAAMLSAGLLLAATGTANAAMDGTVSRATYSTGLFSSSTEVRFAAAANATASHIAFDPDGTTPNVLVSTPTTGSTISAGAGCTQVTPQKVRCGTAGVTRVHALLGDGDDFAANNTNLPNLFEGQNGKDQLLGGPKDDTSLGGNGDDTLFSSAGSDVLQGDGGSDTAVYFLGWPTVTVTLDGAANDGGLVGEKDNVKTENVLAMIQGKAVLRGDANPNILASGPGDDVLEGKGGADTLSSAGGKDTIDARHPFDLVNDTVDCGEGTQDTLEADLLPQDPNPIGCETVNRAAL